MGGFLVAILIVFVISKTKKPHNPISFLFFLESRKKLLLGFFLQIVHKLIKTNHRQGVRDISYTQYLNLCQASSVSGKWD